MSSSSDIGVILVDTSAWVEFDRSTGSSIDTLLAELIANTDEIAVSEPVIMEVRWGPENRAEQPVRGNLHEMRTTRFE